MLKLWWRRRRRRRRCRGALQRGPEQLKCIIYLRRFFSFSLQSNFIFVYFYFFQIDIIVGHFTEEEEQDKRENEGIAKSNSEFEQGKTTSFYEFGSISIWISFIRIRSNFPVDRQGFDAR